MKGERCLTCLTDTLISENSPIACCAYCHFCLGMAHCFDITQNVCKIIWWFFKAWGIIKSMTGIFVLQGRHFNLMPNYGS